MRSGSGDFTIYLIIDQCKKLHFHVVCIQEGRHLDSNSIFHLGSSPTYRVLSGHGQSCLFVTFYLV